MDLKINFLEEGIIFVFCKYFFNIVIGYVLFGVFEIIIVFFFLYILVLFFFINNEIWELKIYMLDFFKFISLEKCKNLVYVIKYM